MPALSSKMNMTPRTYTSSPTNPLRISVAMCTYNGSRYLAEQLRSLASQQRLPDELVLCDDGSLDDTVSLAEEFAREAPFVIRVIRNPQNLGYSQNFAKAIELCSGDVIALADQDDVWYPQKLERLSDLFLTYPAMGGVFSNGNLIDGNSELVAGDLWGSFGFRPADQVRLRSGEALEVLLQRNVVTGMAFAFRRCWRDKLRLMPASWPHDAWLGLMLANENKLLACSEPLVAYRVHENQKIGVPITTLEKRRYIQTHGIQAYLQLSRDRNVEEYRKYAQHFEDLLAAYRENASGKEQKLLVLARAKACHARNGERLLAMHRFRRWPEVLKRRESYKLYSPTGTAAMIRDLIL